MRSNLFAFSALRRRTSTLTASKTGKKRTLKRTSTRGTNTLSMRFSSRFGVARTKSVLVRVVRAA